MVSSSGKSREVQTCLTTIMLKNFTKIDYQLDLIQIDTKVIDFTQIVSGPQTF